MPATSNPSGAESSATAQSQALSQAAPAPARLTSLHIGISWATEGAGGSGRVFADLARYLPEQGVSFLGAVAAPAQVEEATGGAIRNFTPNGGGGLARLTGARRTIRDILQSRKPDLLASHFAFFTAPALDMLGRQPFVVHFHGPWAAESRQEGAGELTARAKHMLEAAVYRRADRVIVLSEAFAGIATRDYGIPRDRIRIVPGAVDLERFATPQSRTEARQALGWPTDRRILVSVRRLVRRMGLGALLTAMKGIVREHPDVLLLIAGKGALRAELEAQIVRLQLENHVRLLGFVPDPQLPLVYRAADINVVPTQALEGFGLVAAEALAAGTPSLVTPIGGLPEVVAGLSPQLVFRSSDAPEIERGLRDALSGSVPLPSQQACRTYAAERFSAQRMAAHTAEIYRELLT